MPLPVVPAILAAGAVSRGAGDVASVVAIVVGAALCADVAWYGVGRLSGARAAVLISARFLPEANPVAASLAGASSVIWASTWTAMGYVLGAMTWDLITTTW